MCQLSLCFWPKWIELRPENAEDSGIMVGLWRQCIRYLPDKYECYENIDSTQEDADDTLCK